MGWTADAKGAFPVRAEATCVSAPVVPMLNWITLLAGWAPVCCATVANRSPPEGSTESDVGFPESDSAAGESAVSVPPGLVPAGCAMANCWIEPAWLPTPPWAT